MVVGAGDGDRGNRTTNPLLLGLIIAVVAFVVAARRSDAAWATGFGAYLVLGLVVVAMRVVFRMLFDGQSGEHVLFTLPEIPLPGGAAGVRIGGPVSLEGVLAAFYDGLRAGDAADLPGSTNVLANPKRLLKSLPTALYEVGAAVTVALSVAPQLIESGRRVIHARRLRGDVGRRTRWFRQVVIPVMTDALDRSLLLAAAMDSRGYGRSGGEAPIARRLTGVLVIAGMLGICIGTYGLLDATAPRTLGFPMLALGLLLAVAGFVASGSRTHRTRYRPDRWHSAGSGVAAIGGTFVAVGMSSSRRSTRRTRPVVAAVAVAGTAPAGDHGDPRRGAARGHRPTAGPDRSDHGQSGSRPWRGDRAPRPSRTGEIDRGGA